MYATQMVALAWFIHSWFDVSPSTKKVLYETLDTVGVIVTEAVDYVSSFLPSRISQERWRVNVQVSWPAD